MKTVNLASSKGTFSDFKSDVLNDYYIAALSRQVSILGRKEVLSGKGKFGIFGDGKELAQIAMAKVFKNVLSCQPLVNKTIEQYALSIGF